MASHGDAGFSDDSLKQLGIALKPGTSAVITVSNIDFLKTIRAKANEADMHATIANLTERISTQLDAGKDMITSLIIGKLAS